MYDSNNFRTKLSEGLNRIKDLELSDLFLPTSKTFRTNLTQAGKVLQSIQPPKFSKGQEVADELKTKGEIGKSIAADIEFKRGITKSVSGFFTSMINDYGKTFEKVGKKDKLGFWDYMNLSDFTPYGLAGGIFAGGVKPIVKEGAERLGSDVLEQTTRRKGASVLADIYKGFEEGRNIKAVKSQAGVRTQLLDKFTPIFDLVRQAKKEIPSSENPYKRIRLLSGLGGKVEAVMKSNLSPILKANANRLDDLSALLVLQREDELIKRNLVRRRSADEVKDGLLELYAKYGQEEFSKLKGSANDVRAFGQSLLRELYNSGIISEKNYRSIQKNNEFYVPFEIVDHMADNLERGQFRYSYNVASQNVIKSIGSTQKAIADPIESLVRKIPKVISLTEKNKALQTLVHLPELDNTFSDVIKPLIPIKTTVEKITKGKVIKTVVNKYPSVPEGFGVINVFEDGKNAKYLVPSEIEAAVKHLDAESANILIRLLSPQAKLLRAGATTLNIGFIPANIIRDISDAVLTETTENGVKGLASLISSYPRALASAFFKGDLYNQWLMAGGAQSTLTSQLFSKAPKTVKELSGNKVKMLINLPSELLQFVNRVGEESTRLARYSSGIKRGEDVVEAAFKSRDITLDFAKSGNTLKSLNQVVPFLNAGVQGSEKLLRLFKDNPAKAVYYSTILYGIPSVMLYRHNSQFKDFTDIPQQERDTNWIFMTRDRTEEEVQQGEKIHGIKIPKGFMGRPVASLTDSLLDFVKEKNPKAFLEFMANTSEEFSPIGLPISKERLGRSISRVTPPVFEAIIQGVTNRDLYYGTPIVPKRLEGVEAGEQYTEGTSKFAISLGKKLGVSPMKIEAAITSLTGGLGKQAEDLLSGDLRGATVEPIEKRFIGIREGKNVDEEYEKLLKYQTESKTDSLLRQREAEQIFNEIEGLSRTNQAKRLAVLRRDNPLLFKKVKDVMTDEKLGLTSIERMIKSLPVEDGTRANYIWNDLKNLNEDEQRELIKYWKRKGIISKQVYSQLLELKNK